jgi:hypothetical protein
VVGGDSHLAVESFGERYGLNVKGINLKECDEIRCASMIEGNLID